ncbi:LysR family transcriptional regulator [Conexibacter woesei]|uniref:LysR family transcriptional regulator n=1 Tax=Conexibacter woesei TaxID=191495 RepID=UPI00040FE73C|nr:LysR family transcriptional regulator [Conexibacter woesei]
MPGAATTTGGASGAGGSATMAPSGEPDVRRLRVLRAVAEHGSFAAAAAELRYTPSAVSQQIAALEREVGIVLVERGARGARLTQAGVVLDRHAAIVLGQLAAARAELDDLAALRGGTVRLAAFESSWTVLVPAAVARFRAAFPDVDLQLAEEDPVEAVAGVRAGACDVAVVFEPNGAERLEGLERTVVAHDPLWAVLPAGHALASAAGPAPLDLAVLAAEPWVAPTAFCATVVRGACAAAGFEPDVVFSSADYGAVQGFVAAGAGVALVPFLALTGNPRVVARPVLGAPSRVLAAVTAPEGPRPASATAMVAALAEAAEELLPT